MAAFTTTPTPAGEGPSLFGIAKSIGTKIRDAAEQAKEEKEKATAAGETPKKGSLFKSALKNQFNPVKSKQAKGNWNKQFSWNKKSDKPEAVNGKPTGGGTGGGEKLKNFIAGGFSAIIADTTQMVAKLSAINDASDSTLNATSRSSGTLVAIKELVDTQTDLRTQQLESQERALAESKLEQTRQVGKSSSPTSSGEGNATGGGEGEGGGGGDLLGGLFGGLDAIESIMQIRNLMSGGKAAGAAAGQAGGIGAGAAAAIVSGVGLAMSAGGEGMFQLGKLGDQSLKDRRKLIEEKKARGENTFLDETLQVGQTGLGEVGKTLGTAMDVGGAPFRYAIEALRNPFLNEEQKKEQAYNLAKFDTRIREHSRGWMNRIDFMNIIPDQKGGFGNIYGNEAATKDMAGKMSEGGIIKKLAPGGLVDNPLRTTLNPGDAVIPLNRNTGREFLDNNNADKPTASPEDTALDTVGAMILGVSSRLLGETETGTVGDQVKQKINKAAKQFGISNLTFTSDIGRGQFGKIDPKRSAQDFMSSLFDGITVMGGGGGKKGGSKKTTPAAGSVAEQAKTMEGKTASEAVGFMDEQDKVLTKAGVPNAVYGSADVLGDVIDQHWCASFVASVLASKGFKPPNSAFADSYRADGSSFAKTPGWGEDVKPADAKPGDVITFDYKSGDNIAEHVAIVTANDGKNITYVGGNQGGGSPRNSKVTEGTVSVSDKTVFKVTRPKETLGTSTGGNADAQQVARGVASKLNTPQASAASESTAPSVVQVAQDGMVGPSWMPWNWGKVVDKHRSAKSSDYSNQNSFLAQAAKRREMMKELGYSTGGVSSRQRQNQENARRARQAAEQRRASAASAQRSRLGVQKVNGRWVNMGVSDSATKNRWWQVWDKKGRAQRNRAAAEKQAIALAARLNKEQGLNKPKPAPAAPPQRARAPVPAARPAGGGGGSSAASKPSTAVVNNVMTSAASGGSSNPAVASGSFGGAVPAGRTRSMGFADFLYEDLV